MKQLTLIRHARSCRAPGQDDFERPLSDAGFRQALEVAQRLSAVLDKPDLILSSGARRSLSTAEIFAEALDYPPEEIQADTDIYSGYDSTLINLLQGSSDQYQHILLIGHNPGISQLVRYLAATPLDELAPCSLVSLHLTITQWCELAESCATILHRDQPEGEASIIPESISKAFT